MKPGKQISPYLELCCLCTSANVSYAAAESDVAMLTGIRVSSKTQQRLVQGYDFPLPSADSPIQEAGVDGGKVRLRTPWVNAQCGEITKPLLPLKAGLPISTTTRSYSIG